MTEHVPEAARDNPEAPTGSGGDAGGHVLPLAPTQVDFVLFDARHPGLYLGPHFSVVSASVATGPLDVGVLRRAVLGLAAEHEALRTVFRRGAGPGTEGWRQVVLPDGPGEAPLDEIDLADVPVRDGEPVTTACLRHSGRVAFDLAAAPLFAVRVYRLGAERALVCVRAHHMIIDDEGVHLLLGMLWDRYARLTGHSPPAEPAARRSTWSEFTRAESERRGAGGDPEATATFWKEFFADGPETGHPREDVGEAGRTGRLGIEVLPMPDGFREAFDRTAAADKLFPGALSAAVFGRFFSARNDGADTTYWFTQTARLRPALRTLLGPMVWIFPVRAGREAPVADTTRRIQTHVMRANRHVSLTGAQLRGLAWPGDEAHRFATTHMPVVFQYLPARAAVREIGGLVLEAVNVNLSSHDEQPFHGLQFNLQPGDDSYLTCWYDRGSVRRDSVTEMLHALRAEFLDCCGRGDAPGTREGTDEYS